MENKKENFSEWYNEIIDLAKLSDKRYAIKGMNVWLPYGLKIMRLIDNIIRDNVDNKSFQEVSFPVLITRSQLETEFEHIKGFENEIYWVTKGGSEKLDIELALRPTSESAMYTMFPLWIRSHQDLPLKIYQIVSVYRYETKHTRSFIRVREIHFFEAHTAHVDYEDAERQMSEYMDIWSSIAEKLCLPYNIDMRPDWDKFPGAKYTLAFDTLMPSGRSLQIGTIHEYGENFARNYDIKYLDINGDLKYVSQTTFGLSERLLAAVIGIHGDDTGLILPASIAPVQAIIIPIPGKSFKEVLDYSGKILSMLKDINVRAEIDSRENYTPGYKYNDWEMRGVPLRIEIGSREMESSTVTVVSRLNKKRLNISIKEINNIKNMLNEHDKQLTLNAWKMMEENTVFIDDINNIPMNKDVLIKAYWCGSRECSDALEQKKDVTALGTLYNLNDSGKCIVCGNPGRLSMFARSY
ncbi:proline--tRNA ligase [Picrophilus oshimae]|uniref:Proline--tRNA ligase n=1 Tax=Picrophilus torridus (strain ATCC 700027 / DSM 9790 / JCM 10055 / NBRC 100828 / KAW 2/3) TaxID=1122961 RepID=A0A8G2FWZ7_PICTO|nr:proline--tRNA ligase [Picrophilus oshimae]SMD30978.1 prolyl-tRNA synthetase [Picrophilus oshimae DSM 9789]